MGWPCAVLPRPHDGGTVQKRDRPSIPKAPVPDRSRLYADMAKLFLQDLANVESGIYPLPVDHDGSLLTLINRSRLFFTDLPEIHRRREGRVHNEIFNKDTQGRGRATICRISTFNQAAG
jgi:hypothetical protein